MKPEDPQLPLDPSGEEALQPVSEVLAQVASVVDPVEAGIRMADPRRPSESGWDRGLVLGAVAIFTLALIMRFWQLDRFPEPVFDEVYFPVMAKQYLDRVEFFDNHPPLGKFMIALNILMFGRNVWGYRTMTALFGAFVPILVTGMVYRLTYRRGFALLSGVLVLTDGLFLVESRYGLINQFLIAFGLAAINFLLAGLERKGSGRFWMLTLSGLMLGATAAVKWNGLWFAFMFGLLGIMVWAIRFLWPKQLPELGILNEILHLKWWHYVACFMVAPFILYFIQWIPHLMFNPQGGWAESKIPTNLVEYFRSFTEVNKALLGGQTASNLVITDQETVHPYCSTSLRSLSSVLPQLKDFLSNRILSAGAWSWPVVARPVGYYFKAEGDVWTDVHALANPILWWFSTAAILWLSVKGLFKFRAVPAFILIGYAANYLPWFIVSRCVFLYHHMSAAIFSFIGLAWIICHLLENSRTSLRNFGISLIGAVVACQIFFMPVWVGIPLDQKDFYLRMWFRPGPIALFCFSEEACNTTPFKVGPFPGFNWI